MKNLGTVEIDGIIFGILEFSPKDLRLSEKILRKKIFGEGYEPVNKKTELDTFSDYLETKMFREKEKIGLIYFKDIGGVHTTEKIETETIDFPVIGTIPMPYSNNVLLTIAKKEEIGTETIEISNVIGFICKKF